MKKTYITSGLFKGRQVDVTANIRPTQERVRKATFDILQQVIEGCNFLELYAGSGAVGIEALSNGAAEVVFVEKNNQCCKIIETNLAKLGVTSEEQITNSAVSVFLMDALASIDFLHKKNKKFNIVFLDPPYYGELAKKTLQNLSAYDILSPHCSIVVEHNKKDSLGERVGSLTSFKQKRYGDTLLSFYRRS